MQISISYALAGVVAAVGLLGTTASWAGKADDTLNVVLPRDIQTLDNFYSNRRENHIVTKMIDDKLLYIAESGEIAPSLAKSYRFATETTLEFELRQGIKFHDGSEMTAEDVAYSFNYQLMEKSEAVRQPRFANWLEKAEVTSPYSVRLVMKQPYDIVLYDIAQYSRVRKKGTYDAPDQKDGIDRNAQRLTHNGLGPYRVVEYVPNQRIRLERNEHYRKDSPKGFPAIRHVMIRIVPDFGTQAAEMMAGSADWAFMVPTDLAEDVGRSGRALYLSGPSMRVGFFTLDADGSAEPGGPLTKLEVRRAINHAIDKESIVKNLVKGTSEVIDAMCSRAQFACTQDVTRYPYDPAKARQLLAAAGYPNGFKLIVWSDRDRPVMEAVVNQLQQVGIKAELRYVKQATLGKAQLQNEVAFFYGSTGSGAIPHTSAIVPSYFGDRADELPYVRDEVLNEIVRKAVSTYDPDTQKRYFVQALERIAEQAYLVPMYEYPQNFLLSKELNFEPSKDGMPRLFRTSWK